MAKRRKLTPPSADDLQRIQDSLHKEPGAAKAPIAQIAGEAASHAAIADAGTRAEAAAHRDAQARGLLITEIPTDQIAANAMARDRTQLIEAEMHELRQSIAASGLRLPIEVYPIDSYPLPKVQYGLLSGYRRLLAVRGLYDLTGDDKYSTIKALIRPGQDSASSFAAMVEENEIRANLSHFERGRIAVIAARSGAFETVEAAVDHLFANASRAKRSKVRSFAQIFEELGDILCYPEDLTEKQGLRLANALRTGAEVQLRQALDDGQKKAGLGGDADSEWQALLPVLDRVETQPRDKSRGGRPAQAPTGISTPIQELQTLHTKAGITLRAQRDAQGYAIRLDGDGITPERLDTVMQGLAKQLNG